MSYPGDGHGSRNGMECWSCDNCVRKDRPRGGSFDDSYVPTQPFRAQNPRTQAQGQGGSDTRDWTDIFVNFFSSFGCTASSGRHDEEAGRNRGGDSSNMRRGFMSERMQVQGAPVDELPPPHVASLAAKPATAFVVESKETLVKMLQPDSGVSQGDVALYTMKLRRMEREAVMRMLSNEQRKTCIKVCRNNVEWLRSLQPYERRGFFNGRGLTEQEIENVNTFLEENFEVFAYTVQHMSAAHIFHGSDRGGDSFMQNPSDALQHENKISLNGGPHTPVSHASPHVHKTHTEHHSHRGHSPGEHHHSRAHSPDHLHHRGHSPIGHSSGQGQGGPSQSFKTVRNREERRVLGTVLGEHYADNGILGMSGVPTKHQKAYGRAQSLGGIPNQNRSSPHSGSPSRTATLNGSPSRTATLNGSPSHHRSSLNGTSSHSRTSTLNGSPSRHKSSLNESSRYTSGAGPHNDKHQDKDSVEAVLQRQLKQLESQAPKGQKSQYLRKSLTN